MSIINWFQHPLPADVLLTLWEQEYIMDISVPSLLDKHATASISSVEALVCGLWGSPSLLITSLYVLYFINEWMARKKGGICAAL